MQVDQIDHSRDTLIRNFLLRRAAASWNCSNRSNSVRSAVRARKLDLQESNAKWRRP